MFRMFSLVLLSLVMLAWPGLGQAQQKKTKILMLFDFSRSMDTFDEVPGAGKDLAPLPTRQDRIIQFLTTKRKDAQGKELTFLDQVLQKGPVTAYRFGAGIDREEGLEFPSEKTWAKKDWEKWLKPAGPGPAGLENLRAGTNVAGSVLQALQRESDNNIQAVILFSDGRSNQGSLESLHELLARVHQPKSSIPVFTVGVGQFRPLVTLRIDDLQAPQAIRPGDAFPVLVPVIASGLRDEPFQVFLEVERVADVQGKSLKGEKWVLGPMPGKFMGPGDFSHAQVEFIIDLNQIGGRQDREALEGTWQFVARVPRHERETGPRKEHISDPVRVEVLERRPRALLFSSGPGREFQFVRNLLAREVLEKRLDLSLFLQSQKEGNVDHGINPERVLTRFPDQLVPGKEGKRFYSLSEYDVILAFDPDWNSVKKESLENLKKWVERGGTIIFVAGPVDTYQLARATGKNLPDLQAILPVALKDSRLHGISHDPTRPYPLNFSPAAKRFPFLDIEGENLQAGWDQFFWGKAPPEKPGKAVPQRGFHNYYPVEKIKPAAEVLATFAGPPATFLEDGKEQPFLVTMPFGAGKSFYLGSAETWRLRLYKEAAFERFWIQWLGFASKAAGQSKKLGRIAMARHATPGAMVIEAQLLGENLQPLPRDQKPAVLVTKLDGKSKPATFTLQARPTQGEWTGWFVGTLQIKEPGEYDIRISIPGTTETLSHRLRVHVPDFETDNLRPDFAALFQIASLADPVLQNLEEKTRKEILTFLKNPDDVPLDQTPKPRLFFHLKDAQTIAACLSQSQGKPKKNGANPAPQPKKEKVQAKDKSKILIVDGSSEKGEKADGFFIQAALASFPGNPFEITRVYGVKFLDQDLGKYQSVFFLNVPELSPFQVVNLEKFVVQGGGVAFFLGPQVSSAFYNQKLYKDGKGIFPVPLEETFFPPTGKDPIRPEFSADVGLLLRDELFPKWSEYPIFGKVFDTKSSRDMLRFFPVQRYFKVAGNQNPPDRKKVFELANLPNEAPSHQYRKEILPLIQDRLDEILQKNVALKKKYGPALDRRSLALVKNYLDPASVKKAFELAGAIDDLLWDRGDLKFANLREFWSQPDPQIRQLLKELLTAGSKARFGPPMVVAARPGKGRVVAVMTSADRKWNDWPAGSLAELWFVPFIYELQQFLSGKEPPLPPGEKLKATLELTYPPTQPPARPDLDKGLKKFADAYLVTPRARIPFRVALRSAQLPERVYWTMQAEPVDVEIFKVEKNALQPFLHDPGLKKGQDRKTQKEYVSTLVFSLEKEAWAREKLVREVLHGETRPARNFQDLEDVVVFDLAEHLTRKEKLFQHYYVTLSVTLPDEDGKDLLAGSDKTSFSFLVVSEAEFLMLHHREENARRQQTEDALRKIGKARDILHDQIGLLKKPAAQADLLTLRLKEARKSFEEAADQLTDVLAAYRKFLAEWMPNRVDEKKIDNGLNRILEPLDDMLFPETSGPRMKFSSFPRARDYLAAYRKSLQAERNPAIHLENAQKIHDELGYLLDKVENVLLIMSAEYAQGRILEMILQMEWKQRKR